MKVYCIVTGSPKTGVGHILWMFRERSLAETRLKQFSETGIYATIEDYETE
jgi:spore coat polysaccharide biosynthesis predicted glycosyltransferase SpsG